MLSGAFYGASVDLWAVGVIVFILLAPGTLVRRHRCCRLSGSEPFYAESDEMMFVRILRCDYSIEGDEWKGISFNAKASTRDMLPADISTGSDRAAHVQARAEPSHRHSGTGACVGRGLSSCNSSSPLTSSGPRRQQRAHARNAGEHPRVQRAPPTQSVAVLLLTVPW